jgi:hypothetical protein
MNPASLFERWLSAALDPHMFLLSEFVDQVRMEPEVLKHETNQGDRPALEAH